MWPGYPTTVSVFLGAALTATSVGITARVLSDLGHLKSDEAQVILGAAVIDDILGLVLLTVISAVAAGEKL
jgi:Kef-type K+ transport system membrane component KefB